MLFTLIVAAAITAGSDGVIAQNKTNDTKSSQQLKMTKEEIELLEQLEMLEVLDLLENPNISLETERSLGENADRRKD